MLPIEIRTLCMRKRRSGGFTLMEALLSALLLALLASGISTLYLSGMKTLDVYTEQRLIESKLRSEMEVVLSKDFAQVASSTYTVTLCGSSYSVELTAELVDLNGDGTPEPNAKQVSLTLEGRTLSTLIVDHDGAVSKIL
ncbi:MAG: prepilin-type N-terminal cleavage/methylation domain-containing protein [Planctomycetota bacterium]